MEIMKVGLIGINSLQEEEHFSKIKNALQKNLHSIYAHNLEEITPISKKHNILTAYSTGELFEKVDAIYFANSLKTNLDFAINALKASCHLFIEDISELTLDEIKQLYKLAFEARTKIQIKLTKAFAPEYIEVKDFIENPQLIEINKSFPSFLRKKDYYFEILDNLNFANQKIKSSIKKISTKVLPIDLNHYSLIHIHILYDNGAISNILLNNIADEEISSASFYELDKNVKIDFKNQFSVMLQCDNGNINRKEFTTSNDSGFNIEIYKFINTCKNFDHQSISESPSELKIIQTTEKIIQEINQSQKTYL